mgnify:FL=1
MKKAEMGIREVIYLILAIFVIILVFVFLGFFEEIREGLVNFFRSNSLLESFK